MAQTKPKRSETQRIKQIRVKSSTGVPGLSQAIEHEVDKAGAVVLLAVGAGAVNQAAKGIARASGSAQYHGKKYIAELRFEYGEGDVVHGDEAGAQISRMAFHVQEVAV